MSSATVDITQRPLDLGASRIYDGTTTINGSDFSTFTNIVGGETLAVTGSGTITSKNVGTGKTVTSVNLALLMEQDRQVIIQLTLLLLT